MKPPRIVVVGSVNANMVVKSQRIPAVGETVTGGQFVMAAGGKGANQAVAAARLGAEVTLVPRSAGTCWAIRLRPITRRKASSPTSSSATPTKPRAWP